MICMSCTATSVAGLEGHSDGERVCLAAEGFGNRNCFLQSMANKVRPFVYLSLSLSMGGDPWGVFAGPRAGADHLRTSRLGGGVEADRAPSGSE